MRKTIKKANSKWILLFLFWLMSVGVRGQDSNSYKVDFKAVGGREWTEYGVNPKYLLKLPAGLVNLPSDLTISVNINVNVPSYLGGSTPSYDWTDSSGYQYPDTFLESILNSIMSGWGSVWGSNDSGYFFVDSGGGGGGGNDGTSDPINCPGVVCPYGYAINAYCECVNLSLLWYFDGDGDGWHSKTQMSQTCPGSFNWSLATLGIDCDDNDSLLKKNCTFKLLAVHDETGNDTDKHVFNKTGDLKIKVVFELTGETDANTLTALIPNLSITTDLVGTLLVPSSIQNSGTKFEVLLTKTGMPDKNSDFGNKTIYLKYKGTAKNTKVIKVFFDKDDKTNKSGVPNWFYYWKEGNVCGIPATAIYDSTADFGFTSPGVDSILRLGPLAATTNNGPETFTALKTTYGSMTVTGTGSGINCVAETVAHELYHLTLYNSSLGLTDTDRDEVSNASEAGGFGATTDPLDPDTFNMRGLYPNYATYGDNEVRCRKKELNTGVAVRNDLDWSKDGKQW